VATPVSNTAPALGQDTAALRTTSADLEALLGPPPIIYGEAKDVYDAFFARVQASVRPKDIVEEIWVRDVVDLVWWAQRLRRLRDNLLVAKTQEAIRAVMRPLIGLENALILAEGWAWREPESVEKLQSYLRQTELTMDVVMAQALQIALNDIERIDGMIMKAEARRNAALREIERHRAALADALRRATESVRDAEFTEVGCDQAPA
jgi:hypothetical protein